VAAEEFSPSCETSSAKPGTANNGSSIATQSNIANILCNDVLILFSKSGSSNSQNTF
jgi:uncharacterized protein YbbK (DUF523 family)